MYQTIRNFSQQFLASWKILQDVDLLDLPKQKIQRVFHVGMGGSSLAADLFNDYLQGECYLRIIRDYQLPADAGPKDLVIASSFSGNTEETLAALEDALHKQSSIAVMSHGGQLREIALQYRLPFIPIPDCIQPRSATGYFFSSLLGLLERSHQISPQQKHLEELTVFLSDRQDLFEEKGKEIAKALTNRIPIIYGPSQFSGTCRAWKIKFNENAKIQSFYNVLPELNHNEMLGFTQLLMKPSLIFLKSQTMHPQILKRIDVMKELLAPRLPIMTCQLSGANILQAIFESLNIADYASYHLALAYGVDPVPVEMVEEFKKRLRSEPEAANLEPFLRVKK